MTPIEAWRYRDNYLKQLQEGKATPDLQNVLTNKLLEVQLKEIDEENNNRKMLIWKKFKKTGKKKGVTIMKRLVNKWLGRERSDIREKIDAERERIMNRLQNHQQILNRVRKIQKKNIGDAKFMPLLDEAIEKNKVLRTINYKDHINKILEKRLNNDWKRQIKENKEDKRRMIQLIKEANLEREEILQKQNEIQEIGGRGSGLPNPVSGIARV
jgi:hypothetical protein